MADGFTVVIPTSGRVAAVRQQVARLQAMDGAPDQVVVVDDGSPPESAADLTSLEGGGVVVVRTEGVGPASARNRGAAAAAGEWLLFLDDDDLPDPSWIRAFRDLAAAHPDAAYLAGASRTRSGATTSAVPVEDLGPAFAGLVGSFRAGTFALRRSTFHELGGFLDGLRFMELTELVLRLGQLLAPRRGSTAVTPDALITIVSRPAGDREAMAPRTFVPSARLAMGSIEHLLARDPRFHAGCLAALGVAEIRLGDTAAGRATLWRAAQVRPWPPVQVLRALAASVPSLRLRVWGGPVAPT